MFSPDVVHPAGICWLKSGLWARSSPSPARCDDQANATASRSGCRTRAVSPASARPWFARATTWSSTAVTRSATGAGAGSGGGSAGATASTVGSGGGITGGGAVLRTLGCVWVTTGAAGAAQPTGASTASAATSTAHARRRRVRPATRRPSMATTVVAADRSLIARCADVTGPERDRMPVRPRSAAEQAAEPAALLLRGLAAAGHHRLARLDQHVALAAEGHLEQLAGAAAEHRLETAGVHPDVHAHPGRPHHDGLGIGEGRGARDVEGHRLARGGDGDVAGATQRHVEQTAGHHAATRLHPVDVPLDGRGERQHVGAVDKYFRDLGVLTYLEASGRAADAAERDRVMGVLRDLNAGAAIRSFALHTAPPPAPGMAGAVPPPPGMAGATPPPAPAEAAPPAPAAPVSPPPPPSWMTGADAGA